MAIMGGGGGGDQMTILLDLPSHIILDILTRLPIRTIISCRCVCKGWLKLLSDPEFASLHLSRSPVSLLVNHFVRTNPPFRVHELEDELGHHDLRYDPSIRFNLPVEDSSNLVLLGSTDGLVCLNGLGGAEDTRFDTVHICNPTTREYITLPEPQGKREFPNLVAYGFGSSQSNEDYKLVRIYQQYTHHPGGGSMNIINSEGQVYCIGEGYWRSIGCVRYGFGCRLFGVNLKGSLHWLIEDPDGEELICGFDLDKETFQPLAAPSGLKGDTAGSLGVLGDSLCLCENASDSDLAIWVMKDYGVQKSWTKEFVISRQDVPWWLSYEVVRALKLFKDGEILFLYSQFELFFYHPEIKSWTEVNVHGQFEAITYIPSFISLKNIALETVKTF